MNGQTFITLVIDKWLSLGQTVTANRAEFREWVNHCIQRRVNHVWLYTWPWTYQDAQSAINTDESEVILPADYHSFTKDGQIYLESGGRSLTWLPPLQLFRKLKRLTNPDIVPGGEPTHYTEFLSTLNASGKYTGGRRVFVYPRPTVETNVILHYKTKAPTITDATDVVAATVSNMEAIPSEYQESWFLDGVLSDLLDKQGDARAASYEARYVKGREEAFADENQGQNTPRRWGRRWGPRWASC